MIRGDNFTRSTGEKSFIAIVILEKLTIEQFQNFFALIFFSLTVL